MRGITEYIFGYDYDGIHHVAKLKIPEETVEHLDLARINTKDMLKRKGLDLEKIKNWTETQVHAVLTDEDFKVERIHYWGADMEKYFSGLEQRK